MAKIDQFLQYFKRLNPAQREAVETIEGPVMVVAGPGTGKTQVLTLRIANILRETDTPPDGILALTFTQSGVHAMRERLVEIVGPRGYRVNIHTFHGFCNEIIQKYPAEFPRIIGAQSIAKVGQIKILEKIIKETKLKTLKPSGSPFHHLQNILTEIERLKKDNLKKSDHPELNLIYREYEKALRREKRYDFADMIMEVIAVLKKKRSFLRRLQEEYLYLLADEHQDANRGQNELLALLSNYHQNPNLFIVGDEKQAIYQFQGASLDNFNYFQKLYPQARLINLTHSYRSHQIILDAAHSLIDSGKLLAASKIEAQKIQVMACANAAAEQNFVAAEIKQKISAGVSPDEIAVIYRDNADAAPVAEALERAGVPIVVQSQSDLLNDLTIGKIVLVLEAVYHFGRAEYLQRFLHLDFLQLDSLAIYQIKSYEELKPSKNRDLRAVYQKLEKWHQASHNQNLLDLFGVILADTKLLEYLLKTPQAEEKLAKLQLFYEELKELASDYANFKLADFIDYLETLRRHNLGLMQTVLPERAGVRLMTAHRAKGLEFDEVYIVGATDGHFGNRRARATLSPKEVDAGDNGLPAGEAGERRLFYVALTRARKNVTITYAKTGAGNKPQLPSQFIEELDKKLLTFTDLKNVKISPQEALRPRPVIKSSLSEKAYLNKLFLDRGLSVTDLNNYLDCPLKYFYQNLLRLTQVQEKHQLYGTAVHQTLKEFFDAYREGKKWPETKLIEHFKYYCERQPFSPSDLEVSLEKGEKALAGYLKFYKYRWPNRIINEFSVRGVFLDQKIKLNGKIDKLEISESGETRVVDYKTGKPKTRNHLIGLTKAAGSGDYFRQLVFYKLLLEKFEPQKYRVTSGLIDFVEPDEKERYKQEEFALGSSDVAGLTEQIKQVASEILSLEFLNRGCHKKDCDCAAYAR